MTREALRTFFEAIGFGALAYCALNLNRRLERLEDAERRRARRRQTGGIPPWH